MTARQKSESPVGAGLIASQTDSDDHDSHTARRAHQALRTIEGERKAADYLARLDAKLADPDELAQIVSMLYGATLRGFCRAIEKALGTHHA